MTIDDAENWNEWCLLEIDADTDDVLDNLHRASALLGVNAWELSILRSIWYSYGQVESKVLLAR